MKLHLFPDPKRPLNKEQLIVFAKLYAMWFVGFAYFLIALEVDTYYYRGSFITFIFAALWLPLRWDRHLPAKMRKESWADKNVIVS